MTRSAAARQLGEVQRLHPHELNTLLTRTATYLRSATWETRVAAAEAVRAIVSNLPQWEPSPIEGNMDKEDESHSPSLSCMGRLRFSQFAMKKVLENSTHLMASEGKEFDMEEDSALGIDMKERLTKQRQLLNARLGLDGAASLGLDVSGIFTNEDLTVSTPDPSTETKFDSIRKPLRDIISSATSDLGLSSREINRARRKARQSAVGKQRSKDTSETIDNGAEEPDKKKIKLEEVKVKEEINNSIIDVEPCDSADWPLEWFCDQLSQDLFSSSWGTRHGAATALREVLTVHGSGAGKSIYQAKEQMSLQHQSYLEDVAIRLLCVLALDRFGDYVSDAVVAPVRETSAQCLCVVLKIMDLSGCLGALHVLKELLGQEEWEARHGGLLGLKYLLAVREDIIDVLLPDAFPYILQGLSDVTDDVGAVAAAALIPVAAKLVELVPESIPTVVTKLWDLLADQDELAAACNSFMGLLAAILSMKEAQPYLPPQNLPDVVPRLFPFLAHSTSSVRKATLQTLGTLTSEPALQWSAQLLQDALRHVFQRVLVEPLPEVRTVSEQVWRHLVTNSDLVQLLLASCPMVATWLCLSMQPTRVSFDPGHLIHARNGGGGRRKSEGRTGVGGTGTGGDGVGFDLGDKGAVAGVLMSPKLYIGGYETTPLLTRETNAVQVRCMTSRMLGLLSCYIVKPAPGVDYTTPTTPSTPNCPPTTPSPATDHPLTSYVNILLVHLCSKSAQQRLVAALVVAEWAKCSRELEDETKEVEKINGAKCPPLLGQKLHACLEEYIYFDEIAHSFTRLTQEAKDFLATLKHYKVPVPGDDSILTLDRIQHLTGDETQNLLNSFKLKPKIQETLEERRRSIQNSAQQTNNEQFTLSISTLAALASAVVAYRSLPDKLSPVVKPLMNSIRREQNEQLQRLSAAHMATLVDVIRSRVPCPNDKILVNLCACLRCDPEFTPVVHRVTKGEGTGEGGVYGERPIGNYNGIVTLNNQQRNAERAAFRRSNSTGRGPGRPPATDIPLEELFGGDDETQKQRRVQRRGATFALTRIAAHFGEQLPETLPKLWELMVGRLESTIDPNSSMFTPAEHLDRDEDAEQLVWALQVLEVTAPSVAAALRHKLMDITLARLCTLLKHPYRAVRHLTARCLAVFAGMDSVVVMESVVQKVLPLLADTTSDLNRQGAVEALAAIVDRLQYEIIPYVVLLVVPLLGRMSDQNRCVRLLGTHTFATLVQLMPLDGGVPEPPALKDSCLNRQREKEREFLRQLLTPTSIPDFVVPVPIDAQLRSYQQCGVNWLAFLNRYKLHGILCDDMGLGKTLQSICILAADHFARDSRYKETKLPDSAPLPSLVICPPTLTGHWVYEVEKFLSHKYLKPLQYNGTPFEREKLRQRVCRHNLIVASYDIVRKDNTFFSGIHWNYVILDEGHIIKNGKTRTSIAVKSLLANHRLILSGTPIQNNVLELWSLFDFLMPGFLGTEKQFTARYSKPILASRDPKCSPKEQEAGALAMEALHRQVLPFLLRRMKEDVLDDLPSKITQDYYCELSSLQVQLYDDFARSQAHHTLQQSLGSSVGTATASSMQGNTHIFQALRYLQNVCNHPKLALNPAHPQYATIMTQLQRDNGRLDDIQHSAKLPALRQLLQDCGIGVANDVSTPSTSSTVAAMTAEVQLHAAINQHRALIFCQLKAMLDIIEHDLFKRHMPTVTYLRLDGAVPPSARHSVVQRFNSDPSIDVLLLTTQVGGLGLNLTGADTVIFVEHDWNPMKDLQAMDRAHRIGQRKVVNVYRLITRCTLEEKIMGLQKFKVQTANTVISGENSRLETMGTEQLLDLFSHKATNNSSCYHNQSDGAGCSNSDANSGSVRQILENLPDLWDHKQYEDEYDLSQFISKLSP